MNKVSVKLVRYQYEPVDINLSRSGEIKGNRVSALRITSVERGMGCVRVFVPHSHWHNAFVCKRFIYPKEMSVESRNLVSYNIEKKKKR